MQPIWITKGLCCAEGSDPTQKHQHHDCNQNRAQCTNSGMAKAVAIASKMPAKAAKQGGDELNDQNATKGQVRSSVGYVGRPAIIGGRMVQRGKTSASRQRVGRRIKFLERRSIVLD